MEWTRKVSRRQGDGDKTTALHTTNATAIGAFTPVTSCQQHFQALLYEKSANCLLRRTTQSGQQVIKLYMANTVGYMVW